MRKNFVNAVRDVVLWRHVEGRAYPQLSRDMKRWYEFFYFTTPMKGEKPFNVNTTYEQHVDLTSGVESGSAGTNKVAQLDPWDIAHLHICKRDDQPLSLENATDDEFDAWVKTHAIAVKENGISGWSFDDRCRLVNYALAHGYTLTFVDGTRIPEPTHTDEEEVSPTTPQEEEPTEDASATTMKEG